MEINVPDTKTIRLSNAEKFIEICKQAARECDMTNIHFNKMGMCLGFDFGDGSSVGSAAWMKACGWLTDENFK